MEKYGVEMKREQKTASAEPVGCPSCKRTLPSRQEAEISRCSVCGTKPFEEDNDQA
jgi:ribosomal protein L37AE/L43A